jgi:hypothetical protein
MTSKILAARIWFLTSLVIAAGILMVLLFSYPETWFMFIPALAGLMIGGVPVFILLVLVLPFIKRIFSPFLHRSR